MEILEKLKSYVNYLKSTKHAVPYSYFGPDSDIEYSKDMAKDEVVQDIVADLEKIINGEG